ncbi:oxalyl-CoA decarboxylase [Azospirillum brasilense]|nr:oxalyl-CoA decarboxylase [Azospirillum brasilense]
MQTMSFSVAPLDQGMSFKAKAYQSLRQAITQMDIYGGPSEIRLDERQLCEALGVSRTPVREAMALLEQEGFIRSMPRRGIFVVRKTKAEIIEMITVCAALEGMAARLFVERADERGMADLHEIVPGIPISDLLRMAQGEGLRVISFRHEQNAGNAAAIAGFLTKKPGVCMTVSAPGFLNGLTALANATTNCFPMILISGSSEREIVDLQQGDYEEMDQLAIAKPLCKAAFRVLHAQDIGIAVARAIRAAVSGRPGGVYLDLPAKLFSQVMDAAEGARSLVKVVDAAPAQLPSPDSVARALEVLKGAKRPLIILGKGAAYAQADEAVRELVEKSGIPFLPMSMAKGLLPDTHPQSAGAARSMVLKDADVVVLVGARLNWLLSHGKGKTWGEPGSKTFIQIDIEPREMDSNVAIVAPLVGDIGSCVSALTAGMAKGWTPPPAEWTGAVSARKEANIAKMAPKLMSNASPMNFHGALGALRRVVQERPDALLVNEGANTLDLARGIIDMHQPRKRLDVGTWGVMGIGMGFAVAAAVESGKPVLAVEGDSAFGFSGMEVETICRYNLPVCIVVFNNNGIYKGTDVNPTGGSDPSPMVFVPDSRYDKMMEAFGGAGVNVTTPDELYRAVSAAMDSGRPTLINAVIDPNAGSESGNIGSLNPTSAVRKGPKT